MEKLVYDLVKDRPWLKDQLKKIYQRVFSLAGRRYELLPDSMVIRPNCFFGFHDKSPWSADNEMLAAHQFKGMGNEPELASNPLNIVVFSGESWLEARTIATTRAWNWQQGAQLQWRGENILFNDFIEGECRAVELDRLGNQLKLYSYAVASISSTDRAMASFCFKHFGDVMPGYGYDFEGAGARSNIDPDTLLIVDDQSNLETRIAGDALPEVIMDEQLTGTPFVSHALFSPSGSKLAFMRRLAVPARRRRSALYIYDRGAKTVKRVPFKDMVSHFCWLSDTSLFAYANTDGGDGYYHYEYESDVLTSYSHLLKSVDGHPHAEATGKRIVFDTYPDKHRLQRLAMLDFEKASVIELARLYSPMEFWNEKRVDLHPRLRPDGKFVCVDCSTTKKRSMATLKIEPGIS